MLTFALVGSWTDESDSSDIVPVGLLVMTNDEGSSILALSLLRDWGVLLVRASCSTLSKFGLAHSFVYSCDSASPYSLCCGAHSGVRYLGNSDRKIWSHMPAQTIPHSGLLRCAQTGQPIDVQYLD